LAFQNQLFLDKRAKTPDLPYAVPPNISYNSQLTAFHREA
jgi:hypothetical protein